MYIVEEREKKSRKSINKINWRSYKILIPFLGAGIGALMVIFGFYSYYSITTNPKDLMLDYMYQSIRKMNYSQMQKVTARMNSLAVWELAKMFSNAEMQELALNKDGYCGCYSSSGNNNYATLFVSRASLISDLCPQKCPNLAGSLLITVDWQSSIKKADGEKYDMKPVRINGIPNSYKFFQRDIILQASDLMPL